MARQNNEQLTMDGAATLLSHDMAPTAQERRPSMASRNTGDLAHKLDLVTQERDMLREELDAARTREQAALEREARLWSLLEQRQPQSRRGSGRPLATALPPLPPYGKPNEPMRQRILGLLQDYPHGLTRSQIEQALEISKNLKDISHSTELCGGAPTPFAIPL